MKKILFVFCCLFFGITVLIAQNESSVNYAYLVAARDGVEKIYKPYKDLKIKYKQGWLDKKIRGTFIGEQDGKIVIAKRKNKYFTLIHPDSIIKLRKSNLKPRIYAAAASFGLVLVSVAIIYNSETLGRGMLDRLPVAVAPIVSAVFYYVPISYVVDLLSEKKVQNGWVFTLRK